MCAAAAARAGFGVARCGAIRLLLLLPHPSFLEADPGLRDRMQALVREHVGRGETVALKGHPGAPGKPAHRQLQLPVDTAIEIPARLPVEVLVPLLSGTLVVGGLTTALLSLALLGDRVTVRSLATQPKRGAGRVYENRALEIYESVGVLPLDGRDENPGHPADRRAAR
jgi:hypothetical protein